MNNIEVNWLGKLYDWGSISLILFGDIMIGIDQLDIKEGRNSKNIQGFGQQPIGYVNENVTYSANLGLLYDQVQQIIQSAATSGFKIYQIPPFNILMTLGSTADPLVPYVQLVMSNCRFQTNDFTAKQNQGGFYHQYPIAYAGLKQIN